MTMDNHTSDIPLKRCTICGIEYPAILEYFAVRKLKSGSGLRHQCRECRRYQHHVWRSGENAALQWITEQQEVIRLSALGLKQCSKCGLELPDTLDYFAKNGAGGLRPDCKECCNKARGDWYAVPENRQRTLESNKRYTLANKEQVSLVQKRARAKKPEHYKQLARDWGERNPDKVRESSRKSQKKHLERGRVYYHRYQARKNSLPDTLTLAEWRYALDYFNDCCAVCGRPQGLWHTLSQDHWIPLKSPNCLGTIAKNIVPMCCGIDGCNNSKSSHDPLEWLIKKFGKRKAKDISQRIKDYFDSL